MTIKNHHCCVLRLNDWGVLIEGASGSGKSSLLMGLLERAKDAGLKAQFVCDDQALLDVESSRLIATAPRSIAGKIEVSGYGIIDVPHVSYTKIDLVVRMVPDACIERMPEAKSVGFFGLSIKMIEVPERHESQAIRIVLAVCGGF